MSYEGDYFEEYLKRDDTDIGRELTKARSALVSKHYHGGVVDIGIGGGAFVEHHDCFGYDVNQSAVECLESHGRFCDPYLEKVNAITCWDSLEHIWEPGELLRQVGKYVFMSIPIFDGVDHILSSKHYKPGEHIYYFTNEGLIKYMDGHGFKMLECNDMETVIGREGILSYVFKRK